MKQIKTSSFLILFFLLQTHLLGCGCHDSSNASTGANNINSGYDSLDQTLINKIGEMIALVRQTTVDESANLVKVSNIKILNTHKAVEYEEMKFLKEVERELNE